MIERKHPDVPMSQAEVGGGARVDPEQRLQRPGYLIRDFTLASMQGKSVQLSDYRGRANLVLIFAGESRVIADAFLVEAARQGRAFMEQEAAIITVATCQERSGPESETWTNLPFVVLLDSGGRVHRAYGAVDRNGRPAPVIYVTDRFGEIAAVYPGFDDKKLPSTKQVLKVLEFINHQCPECEPPEWPR